jgi:hypothetical protein
MMVVHTNTVSGINILYPTFVRPRHGVLKVMEVSRLTRIVPRLLVADAMLLLAVFASFAFEQLINYLLIPGVILALCFRVYQTPLVEVRFSRTPTLTVAPRMVILEHCAYFFAVGLMCV